MKIITLLITLIMHQPDDSVKTYNILTIGDSNGTSQEGWVYQLGILRGNDKIFNCSVGGNTIGFDNLGQTKLNTLKNVNQYIKSAEDSLKRLDMILIMLGTNDCKAVFDSLQQDVPGNLEELVDIIFNYPYISQKVPQIVLITPPPIGKDSMLLPKYYGGLMRLERLLPEYKRISEKYNCKYVDIFHPLFNGFESLTVDGIHLNEAGYKKAAFIINEAIK